MTETPPGSQRKALWWEHSQARARAEPTPSRVAYSHRATSRRGVGGRCSGVSLDGADAVEEGGEVEPLDEVPDEAGLVVLFQEVL